MDLRMFARHLDRVDPEVGSFAAPDSERAVFDRHAMQLGAAVLEELERERRGIADRRQLAATAGY